MFFCPIRGPAGSEVVSCLFTRKSLDRHTRLGSFGKVLLEEKSLNHSTKYTGNRSEYRRRPTGPFAGIGTVAYFQDTHLASARDLFKDVLTDSPNKIAAITFDLLFLVEVFLDFLHQLLWLKFC